MGLRWLNKRILIMKKLLLVLIIFTAITGYSQGLLVNGWKRAAPVTTYPDSAQFNFSATALSVAGVTNVVGPPDQAVRTATGAYGITISSVSTAGWPPLGGGAGNSASNTGGVNNTATGEVPAGVLLGYWFNAFGSVDCTAPYTPNLRVGGLVPGATYTATFWGARDASAVAASTREMSIACTDANGTTRQDSYNVKGNTGTNSITFNATANASGQIDFLIQATCPANIATHPYGYANFFKIKRTPRTP